MIEVVTVEQSGDLGVRYVFISCLIWQMLLEQIHTTLQQ